MSDPKIIHIDLTEAIKCDTKTVRLLLEACEELLEYYRGNGSLIACRLCGISRQTMSYCHGCPWVWFTGMPCGIYTVKYSPGFHSITMMRDKLMEPWTSSRIAQLDKTWIPDIKHYLELKGDAG